jgi:hypothetical protein
LFYLSQPYFLFSGVITMSDSTLAQDPAAAAAAAAAGAAAARAMTIEGFTLYGFGVIFTMLRTYARVKSVGFKGLQGDDYLAWVAIVRYPNLLE